MIHLIEKNYPIKQVKNIIILYGLTKNVRFGFIEFITFFLLFLNTMFN